jgi:hypothetical protein
MPPPRIRFASCVELDGRPCARWQSVLLGVLICFLQPIGAARMAPKEHAEAVRSLARCDSTVGDHRGNYFSKVDQRVLPSLPAKGCWYLFMGSSELPGELKKLLKQPNGDPIGNVPPHSGRMLSYTDKSEYIVAVPWKDRNPHLIAPPLKASVPRSRVMHTRWEPESSTLEQIDAPASCTGTGYPPSQPGATTAQRIISRDRESTPPSMRPRRHAVHPRPRAIVRVQRVGMATYGCSGYG